MIPTKNENIEIKSIEQAISVLIQGCQLAQARGVYTLEDAELISKAIKFIKSLAENKDAVITDSNNQ